MNGSYNMKKYFDSYVIYGTKETSWNSESVLVLNEVAYTIFTLLEKGSAIQEIVTALIDEYEVDENIALRDTQDFIEILKKKNFINELK